MPRILYAGELPRPILHSQRHIHDHWEVCLYVHGRGDALIGEQRIPFTEGSIILYPPRIPHEERAVTAEGFRCAFLALDRFLPAGAPAASCHEDVAGEFRSAFRSLIREAHSRLPLADEATRALCGLLCTWLLRWTRSPDALVSQAEQLLHARLADPSLRIDAVARRLGISERRLRSRFAAVHGCSPRQFLTRLRLEQGRALLRSGHPVAQTAAMVGLNDPFWFSKMFRIAFGVMPSSLNGRA